MTKDTIQLLNKVNQDFYNSISESFDNSRQYYWEGWNILWDFIIHNNISIESILDLGCGNARFLKFLESRIYALCHSGSVNSIDILNNKFRYIGMDNNQYLLNKAQSIIRPNTLILKLDILFEN